MNRGLSDFMRGLILFAVFLRRRPGEDSPGTSGGGAVKDDAHLLREKPPALHQEAVTQPGRREREDLTGKVTETLPTDTMKVVKIILEMGFYLQPSTCIPHAHRCSLVARDCCHGAERIPIGRAALHFLLFFCLELL